METLTRAIGLVGLMPIASACGVSYQAIRKWERNGLPRTEFTGETMYALAISQATNGKVSAAALIEETRALLLAKRADQRNEAAA